MISNWIMEVLSFACYRTRYVFNLTRPQSSSYNTRQRKSCARGRGTGDEARNMWGIFGGDMCGIFGGKLKGYGIF